MKECEILDLPGMSPQTALAFFLAEQYLFEMLPPTTVTALEPHFNQARKVLNNSNSKQLGAWLDKVRVVPENQKLIPPLVNQSIADIVSNALLEDKTLSATYNKRGESAPTSYELIYPLGLVFRQRAIYLVANLNDNKMPIQLALHRFVSAKITDEPFKKPDKFDLDRYIEEGNFAYLLGDELKVKLRFSYNCGVHLLESPISHDQQVSIVPDKSIVISATVNNSNQFRWWLLGFADEVEVLQPISLREEMMQTIKRMSRIYN